MITELVAIKAALAHSKLYPDKRKKVHIYTDSLCAIHAIRNFPPKDNVELINDIIHDITIITRDRKLHIHWLPSHTGIYYNDKADEAANRARTDGKPCPINPSLSSVFSNIKTAIRNQWLKELDYDKSRSWRHYREINPKYTAATFTIKPRNLQVLCTRLKTGGLNYCYMHEETTCEYCQGAYGHFSAGHYLVTCPITSKHCQPLREMLSDEEINLPPAEQGQLILRQLHANPAAAANIINKKPPKVNCASGHKLSTTRHIRIM